MQGVAAAPPPHPAVPADAVRSARVALCTLVTIWSALVCFYPISSWLLEGPLAFSDNWEAEVPPLVAVLGAPLNPEPPGPAAGVPASSPKVARHIASSAAPSADLYRSAAAALAALGLNSSNPAPQVALLTPAASESQCGPPEDPAPEPQGLNLTGYSVLRHDADAGELQMSVVHHHMSSGVWYRPFVCVVEQYARPIGADIAGPAAGRCPGGPDQVAVCGSWRRTGAWVLSGGCNYVAHSADRGALAVAYDTVRHEQKHHKVRILYTLNESTILQRSAAQGYTAGAAEWQPLTACGERCFELPLRGGLAVHLLEFLRDGTCLAVGRVEDVLEFRTICMMFERAWGGGLRGWFRPQGTGPPADRRSFTYQTVVAQELELPPGSPYCGDARPGAAGCAVLLAVRRMGNGQGLTVGVHWHSSSGSREAIPAPTNASLSWLARGPAAGPQPGWRELVRYVDFLPFADSAAGSVEGELVAVGLGCPPHQPKWRDAAECPADLPQEQDRPLEGKVVLARRGNCTFRAKVERAAAAGAAAVLIYNDPQSSNTTLCFAGVHDAPSASRMPVFALSAVAGSVLLAAALGGEHDDPGASGGVRIALRQEGVQEQNGGQGPCLASGDCTITGRQLGLLEDVRRAEVTSAASCCSLCRQAPDCRAWTWDMQGTKQCFLYDMVTGSEATPGLVCGRVAAQANDGWEMQGPIQGAGEEGSQYWNAHQGITQLYVGQGYGHSRNLGKQLKTSSADGRFVALSLIKGRLILINAAAMLAGGKLFSQLEHSEMLRRRTAHIRTLPTGADGSWDDLLALSGLEVSEDSANSQNSQRVTFDPTGDYLCIVTRMGVLVYGRPPPPQGGAEQGGGEEYQGNWGPWLAWLYGVAEIPSGGAGAGRDEGTAAAPGQGAGGEQALDRLGALAMMMLQADPQGAEGAEAGEGARPEGEGEAEADDWVLRWVITDQPPELGARRPVIDTLFIRGNGSVSLLVLYEGGQGAVHLLHSERRPAGCAPREGGAGEGARAGRPDPVQCGTGLLGQYLVLFASTACALAHFLDRDRPRSLLRYLAGSLARTLLGPALPPAPPARRPPAHAVNPPHGRPPLPPARGRPPAPTTPPPMTPPRGRPPAPRRTESRSSSASADAWDEPSLYAPAGGFRFSSPPGGTSRRIDPALPRYASPDFELSPMTPCAGAAAGPSAASAPPFGLGAGDSAVWRQVPAGGWAPPAGPAPGGPSRPLLPGTPPSRRLAPWPAEHGPAGRACAAAAASAAPDGRSCPVPPRTPPRPAGLRGRSSPPGAGALRGWGLPPPRQPSPPPAPPPGAAAPEEIQAPPRPPAARYSGAGRGAAPLPQPGSIVQQPQPEPTPPQPQQRRDAAAGAGAAAPALPELD
eukprot:TRINITY_DN8687_c1_g1_i1.p1 TRINITY_DN8687_c1_g1~~TRINITY_DN8687_c1_g1_i1.p1  ORF type:complete len:1402 (+),score=358.02 TRINITY_DN8687_c1_g1_i1:82-4206(+)